MEPAPASKPAHSVPASHRRFWTLGSVLVITVLVAVGGTGAADSVYATVGRYNLPIVAAVAATVAFAAWRRSRRPGPGKTSAGAA